ncbi:MAG TPA: tetratricopeptide repeat protein [Pyrinomonadaceae bacterium]|jgi:tetratricopeptide (TPR) repeat protein|nr:tetratricopeptide repeat protein [Pyrinomonadaceae bacterium]
MLELLKPLLLMFYAPVRALGLVRDRSPLGFAAALAIAAKVAYVFYTQWAYLGAPLRSGNAFVFVAVLVAAVGSLLLFAVILIPSLIFFANLFERRGSFGLVLQQDYAPLASAIFYAWTAAHLVAFPLAVLARVSGFEADVIAQSQQLSEVFIAQQQMPPEAVAQIRNPQQFVSSFSWMLLMPFFLMWAVIAVREVFRVAWLRAAASVAGGALVMFFVSPFIRQFGGFFTSPFLLVLLFLLLRGYFTEVMRTQRARASFRQNLEAATLNPADASAHYNLGLVHLQRKELDEAKERFTRAVEIDADEVDAHFQLGRIARMENDLPSAISRFEQVVARDDAHSQHEIWREIGATYLDAAQYSDAYDALGRFLARRQTDPEGLYLSGRALSGMGRTREAAEAMRACIEAVKTAPAYKYRAEKRWLNEAQQFLRTQATNQL